MESLGVFDTHTHMYLDEFAPDRSEAMSRAINGEVRWMMFPNVDLSTIAPMKALHDMYPQHTVMAMGLHPTEIDGNWHTVLDAIGQELHSGADYRAVGEIGMDLYWDKTYAAEQAEALDAQLDWAEAAGLPVIIHCREALAEILDLLDSRTGRIPQLIFHSFGGSIDDVRAIRSRTDAFFGINGIVTFKNSRLKEVLPEIGVSRLLLETDAPYLAPVPYRGRRNESSYIVKTAETVAASLKQPLTDLATATALNAGQLFKIK